MVEPNTVRRIAHLAAVGAGDRVVEIGPGLGSLTLALADTGASVIAIEIDDVLVEVLTETTAGRDVTVLHADAMGVDWDSLLGGLQWTLIANLPYNISVPLICDLLDAVPGIGRMLVMVQKEVAERLVAVPGDGAYGLPSVKVAYHSRARIVGRVPPSAFLPRPRVDSALVELQRLEVKAVSVDPDLLFSLVRAGFGQRRKMLRRSLAGLVGAEAFEMAGVAPTARAEELGLDDWASLVEAVAVTG